MEKARKYIILGVVCAVALLLVGIFALSRKIVDIGPEATKPVKETESKNNEDTNENQVIVLDGSQYKTDDYGNPVENFQYGENERQDVVYTAPSSEKSKVASYYIDGEEDKTQKQKEFLGDAYDSLAPVLEQIRDITDKQLAEITQYPLPSMPKFTYLGMTQEGSLKQPVSTLEVQGDYQVEDFCTIIDYFDDTKVVYYDGYRNKLYDRYIFVVDRKDELSMPEYPLRAVRVGDTGVFVRLYKGMYKIVNIGDYHVVFAKSPEI